MMKLALFFLSFFLTTATLAETAPGSPLPVTRMVCATPVLTTSHILTEGPDFFELSVIHHNGVSHMPFYDGIVTPGSLDRIVGLSKMFEKLGDTYRVRFDRSQCRKEAGEWTCGRRGPLKLGELEVQSVWFTVEKRRVVTRFVDYTAYVTRYSFTKDNRTYMTSLEYALQDCVIR